MKDWRRVLREAGIPLGMVFDDVKHECLVDEARNKAELYYPDTSFTNDDIEKIVSAFESQYCEHEIASNVWADVFEEYLKEN